MDANLLGYLLGALEPEEQRRVEDLLAESPDAATRLELLRQALEPMAADKDTIDPPADLAVRTVGLVAEHVVATEGTVAPPGNSPVSDFLRSLGRKEPAPVQVPAYPRHGSEASPVTYGRRNIFAAAGLTAAMLLIGFTAIMTLRQTRDVMACQNNLRAWNNAINTYADNHGNQLPQVRPDEDVRAAWKKLEAAGAVPPGAVYVCAGTGHAPNACAGPGGLPAPHTPDCPIDYAYTLGYWDQGRLQGLTRGSDFDQFPLLADAPERKGGQALAVNHRKGQNVLFVGGNVRFCTTPYVGPEIDGRGDDIYFNTVREPRAGTHRWDSVLGRANEQP